MERNIVFEVQRGESVVINKMDARSWVAASWHCTKMKCLRFLPSCAGRSFGVRALAIASTFPLTTHVFSLLLHPSAPNSWTCTRLTTTSNKKQVFRFSVYRKSTKCKSRTWFGSVYVSCSLPQEGDQNSLASQASICFIAFMTGGCWGLSWQFMGFICQMPELSSSLPTIEHVRKPWPLLSSTFPSFIV